jgi:hypothetical protein
VCFALSGERVLFQHDDGTWEDSRRPFEGVMWQDVADGLGLALTGAAWMLLGFALARPSPNHPWITPISSHMGR